MYPKPREYDGASFVDKKPTCEWERRGASFVDKKSTLNFFFEKSENLFLWNVMERHLWTKNPQSFFTRIIHGEYYFRR